MKEEEERRAGKTRRVRGMWERERREGRGDKRERKIRRGENGGEIREER